MSNLVGRLLQQFIGLFKLRLYEDMANETLNNPRLERTFSKGSTRSFGQLGHGSPAINGLERRVLAFPVNLSNDSSFFGSVMQESRNHHASTHTSSYKEIKQIYSLVRILSLTK